jgi:predicted DNA-binding transcriptional regulator YafY
MKAANNKIAKTPDFRVMQRVESILQRLNMGERLSVKTLAFEFDCSTKTIQRDINERIPRLYKCLGVDFEPTRDGKLIKLENNATFSTFNSDMKLLLNGNEKSHLFTNLSIENMARQTDVMQAIEAIMLSNLMLGFEYKTNKNTLNILLNPLKLICFDGFWYLLGQAGENGAIKKYYVKNISNVRTLGKASIKPKNIDKKIQRAINVWFDANAKEFEVRLYAEKTIAEYFMRMPISATQTLITKDSDGSVELSIMATHENEIIPVVFKWMPSLFVLSPKTLKDKIELMATSFLKKSLQI